MLRDIANTASGPPQKSAAPTPDQSVAAPVKLSQSPPDRQNIDLQVPKAKEDVDQAPQKGHSWLTTLHESMATIVGGLQLAWRASRLGTCLRVGSVMVDAAVPIAAGVALKFVIDNTASGTDLALAWISGGVAVALLTGKTFMSNIATYWSERISQIIKKDSDIVMSKNLAARYEEVFAGKKNDTVVNLRENLWRIEFLSETSMRVMAAIVGMGAALGALAVSRAPWPIVVGAVAVALLPGLNEIFRAKQLHRDEPDTANPRRQYWYMSWFLKEKKAVAELKVLDAHPDMESMSMERLDRIHTLAQQRSWSYMLRAIVLSPAGALLTTATTAYMWHLTRVTAGSENPVTPGDVGFVLSSVLPLVVAALSTFGSTFGKAFEDSPFYRSFRHLSQNVPQLPRATRDASSVPEPAGIEIQDLSFTYSRAALHPPMILKGVNAEILPGQFVAIVGRIGAGKTTLFEILSGLRTPTSGSIILNGTPFTEANRREWAPKIGFVFQDPVQYDSLTLREFLLLGNPGVSEEFMDRVLEATGIKDILSQRFIDDGGTDQLKFPRGLDTVLGEDFEGGRKLSGGERQLFALARAFLRRPEILFLDEPTANVNPLEKKRIMDLVINRGQLLGYEPTVVLIAHDYRVVKKASIIWFLDSSRQGITAIGTHEDLFQTNKLYRDEYLADAGE